MDSLAWSNGGGSISLKRAGTPKAYRENSQREFSCRSRQRYAGSGSVYELISFVPWINNPVFRYLNSAGHKGDGMRIAAPEAVEGSVSGAGLRIFRVKDEHWIYTVRRV